MAHYVRGPGGLLLPEEAAPGTAPNGTGRVWVATDGTLHFTNDGGADVTIGGGAANNWTDINIAADVVYAATSTAGQLFDTALAFNMAANGVYEVTGLLIFTVAATTTGFRTGMKTIAAATAANFQYEWAPTATTTANATQSQSAAILAPGMALQTASGFAAPQVNLVQVQGYVQNGATAQALTQQIASELANTAITLKKGSRLSYRTG